jgi:hypothetical protein
MAVRVVESPWIVVGEVQQVEPYAPPPPAVKTEDDAGALYDWSEKLKNGPSLLASVKIICTLKGPCTVSSLKLTSYEHDGHLTPRQHGFFKGERLLLLLKEIPTGDPSQQPLEAEMLSLDSMKEVENQLLRAKQFQADYLQRLAREQSALHAAALHLAVELQQACAAWPRPKDIDSNWQINFSNDVACCTMRDQLLKKFTAADAELLYAAQAVDWFHESDPSWSRHPVWWAVLDVFSAAHPKEARAVSEKWIRHALQQAGIEQPFADEYVKTDLCAADLRFPIQLKSSMNEAPSRENWTTHLLLCHQDYFGEDIWTHLMYDKHMNGSLPKELNLARLRNSAISSTDLSGVAIPTDLSTVDLLVSAFFDTDLNKHTWSIERRLNAAPNSNILWKTFIQLGTRVDSERFWDRMVSEHFYSAPCLEIAMDLLAQLEKSKPIESPQHAWLKQIKLACVADLREALNDQADAELRDWKSHIRAYLEQAQGYRLEEEMYLETKDRADDEWTAERFRNWFRQHPSKKRF